MFVVGNLMCKQLKVVIPIIYCDYTEYQFQLVMVNVKQNTVQQKDCFQFRSVQHMDKASDGEGQKDPGAPTLFKTVLSCRFFTLDHYTSQLVLIFLTYVIPDEMSKFAAKMKFVTS